MTWPAAGGGHELVERALDAAAGRGCAVLVQETSSVNLRWARNGLTTNGATGSRTVTVVVAGPGDGVGVLTRQGVAENEIGPMVVQAVDAADRSAPAEDAAAFLGPDDVGDVSGSASAPPADWEQPAFRTGPGALDPVAAALGEVFGRSAASGRESFGFALHEVTTTWLGTSAGLRRRYDQPQGTIELTGRSADGGRSTWVGRSTRDFADVDVLALDGDVVERLGWQSRTVDLPPGRYETVLPPSAVADLLTYYLWSSDARSASEGRTAFSRPGGGTRLGERLTDAPMSIRSDPGDAHLPCAPYVLATASSPFASVFDNGLPAGPAVWLDGGVVAALPGTRHTSRTTGIPLRSLSGNLLVSSADGAGSVLDVVADVEEGLLLTCLWYIREVDPATLLLTGLTRDGVYRIERGEVVGAVTNFRWNDSPVDLLARVLSAGAPEVTLGREFGEYVPRTAAPALRVADFNMSTVSEAS